MEILIYAIPFAVFSPLLIIGILKFRKMFLFRKANIECTRARRKETAYDSMWQHARAGVSYTTYGYKKVGTYAFELDGREYELTYSSDRDNGYLPDTITACYPKGRPQDAFAEGNTPFIKMFANAFLFVFIYCMLSSTAMAILLMFV